MRAHVIKDGVVVNTIEVASLNFLPGLIDAGVYGGGIGDLWDGQKLTRPATVVKTPESVTPRQGRAVLIINGHLAQVQGLLDAMAGTDGALARNDFSSALEWRRDWPLIEQMRVALGWTTAYVDELFIAAAKL